jgi:hypothetical protein
MASQAKSNALAPRALAAWAHATFGHQVEFAAHLAQFDDVYDTLDCTNATCEDVDEQVIGEARRIVEATRQGELHDDPTD